MAIQDLEHGNGFAYRSARDPAIRRHDGQVADRWRPQRVDQSSPAALRTSSIRASVIVPRSLTSNKALEREPLLEIFKLIGERYRIRRHYRRKPRPPLSNRPWRAIGRTRFTVLRTCRRGYSLSQHLSAAPFDRVNIVRWHSKPI
jgi:hypothetical protein